MLEWCHWATISPNALVNSSVKKFTVIFIILVVNKNYVKKIRIKYKTYSNLNENSLIKTYK
jgi:hypothetical protein